MTGNWLMSCFMENVNKLWQSFLFFFFLNLDMVLRNSNRGEFSHPRALYRWQSVQVGIIVMKIERAWIHNNYLNDICLLSNSANIVRIVSFNIDNNKFLPCCIDLDLIIQYLDVPQKASFRRLPFHCCRFVCPIYENFCRNVW